MNKMNGTYYEICGGLSKNIVKKAKATADNDKKAKLEAINTERAAYRNTYVDGKRIESIKIYDPYNDEYFAVGTNDIHYEPLSEEKSFEYQMLGRLKLDCDYFLGNGYGYEPHLWAGSVEKQIKEMRDRWNAFEEDEKPEWLTMEQIDEYEKLMLKTRKERKSA